MSEETQEDIGDEAGDATTIYEVITRYTTQYETPEAFAALSDDEVSQIAYLARYGNIGLSEACAIGPEARMRFVKALGDLLSRERSE